MRLHLILALLTVLALVITLRGNHRHRFAFEQVEAMAQQRAAQKYVPLPNLLPPQLRNLTPEQENGIFWNDAYRLWRKKGLPFQVDFYHVNKMFPQAPLINTVDRKGAHPLAYSPAFFRFSGLKLTTPLPASLGYDGFYLRYPINKPDSLDGFFSVQGSNYFRVLAKEQVYGLATRSVALNTGADGKKEEFPEITEWWLKEPAPTDTQLVLYALLDSPSVTGAYEFKVSPGAVTTLDVHGVLFFRQAVEQLGIAPFSSMYLFGENAKNHFNDHFHPEVHDSDGVLINKNNREWVWRPLQQTLDRQIYNFIDENPRGFGLIQRDRDFQHYQDLDSKYNVRPSAWVTPRGNWGKGVVELIQLPTNNTNTDNVVLFWRPESQPKAGDQVPLDYTIDYYMNDAQRPPLAYSKQTLINDPAPAPPLPPAPSVATPPPATKPAGSPAATNATPAAKPALLPPAKPPPAALAPPPTGTTPVQFLVDFVGDGIENVPANQPPDLDLTCSPPETFIREKSVVKNSYDNSWRVTFTIIPARPHVPTEILCHLTRDGKPITETWTYTWHQ